MRRGVEWYAGCGVICVVVCGVQWVVCDAWCAVCGVGCVVWCRVWCGGVGCAECGEVWGWGGVLCVMCCGVRWVTCA